MLEEEFLELMVHLYRHLPMGDIWQTQARDSAAFPSSEEATIQQNLQVRSLLTLFCTCKKLDGSSSTARSPQSIPGVGICSLLTNDILALKLPAWP